MLKFNNESSALDYAHNLGKYDSEIVMVDGHKTFLSNTTLPVEERFREPVENMLEEFFTEMDYKGQDAEDMVAFLGAQICDLIRDKIENETDLRILCAGSCY